MTRAEMEAAIGRQVRSAIDASRRAKLAEAETQRFIGLILAYADAYAAGCCADLTAPKMEADDASL